MKGFNAGGAVGVSAALGAATASLVIRDSAFRDNAIGLATDTTSGTLTLDIERAMFERNAIGADVQGTAYGAIRKSTFSAGGVGISAGAANSGQTVELDIRDCTVSDNAGIGIAAVAPLSPTTLTVISSSVSGNATGIQATGIGNKAYASDNTIMRNDIALNATSSGTVLSGGDNRLLFNISDGIFATELINGALHTGSISLPSQVATWTFNATAGDRIGVHIGEITDNNDFRPWIRLQAPDGTIIGNTSGVAAAVLDGIAAPQTGTYLVLVASFDSGFDGTGTYRLTMTHTPGPITVSPGDQGGPLTNGAMHTGEIVRGDLDVWTFNATAGDRIGVHIGEIVDNDDFRPWIRLWAPNGAVLANTSGTDAAVIDGVAAPVTGTYLVLVASFDSGFDGTGTYRLTMTHTPGPITVSPGDQGGPLTNGALHTGEIVKGDLDVWTFNATAGDRIDVHIGEIVDNDDFRPWIRLWAPDGAVLANTSGVAAAVIDGVAAPLTGTYFVLVASFDSGFDGTGTYRLTMTHTPGPITVSPGDQGGPLTNGALHTGRDCQRRRRYLDLQRHRRRSHRRAHRRNRRQRRFPSLDSPVGAQRRGPRQHLRRRCGRDRWRRRACHRHVPGAGFELRQRLRWHRHVWAHDDSYTGPRHGVPGRSGRPPHQRRAPYRRDHQGRSGRVDLQRQRRRPHRRAHRRNRRQRRLPAVDSPVGSRRHGPRAPRAARVAPVPPGLLAMANLVASLAAARRRARVRHIDAGRSVSVTDARVDKPLLRQAIPTR